MGIKGILFIFSILLSFSLKAKDSLCFDNALSKISISPEVLAQHDQVIATLKARLSKANPNRREAILKKLKEAPVICKKR